MVTNVRNKPVHEERLGRIKACVWENETEAAKVHNVTFVRLYRNQYRQLRIFHLDCR